MAVNAATLVIDIEANGAAQAEQQVRGVGRAVDDTGKKMSAAGNQSSTFGKAMGSVGPLAAAGFAGAGVAAAKFGMDSFNAFASFEKQMNEVFSLMPGISQQSMGEMTSQVKEFSREFGVLPSEVVPALYEALSSGIPPDNVFSFLETAQKTATGGVTELNTAVDGLTSVVNAFGTDTISAADASDIMFQTVKIGKTTIDELSSSLFNVNPVAAALGVGFDQVGAALAAMTSQGVPTAQATTQLRQLFIELSDSSSKLAGTFQTLTGQTFQQFVAGGGTVQQALQILEQHAASTGVGIQDLFSSVEAGGAALALTGQGTEAFSSALDQMANRSGSTEAAFTQMQSGISADIDRMKANFATFQIDVGEKLAGAAVAIMDANLGEKLVNSIQSGIDMAGDLMDKGKQLIDGIIQGAKDAWESGKSFFTDLGSSAVDAVGDLGSTLTQKGTDLLTGFKGGAEDTWNTVSGWLGQRGSDAVSAVGDVGSTLTQKGTDLLNGLKSGAETVWTTIDGWLGGRPAAAVSAIGDLGSTLKQKGTDLLDGLKTGAESGWTNVSTFLGGIAGKATSAVGNLGSALYNAGSDLVGGLIRGIQSQIRPLNDALSALRSMVPSPGSGVPFVPGFAGGGTIQKGWGVVGEQGWEAFYLDPQRGLTIFPHDQSRRMFPRQGVQGYAAGTTVGTQGGDLKLAHGFAAYIAGDRSPGAVAAYEQGLQNISNYLAAQQQAIEAEQRSQEHLKQLALRIGHLGGRDQANRVLTDLSAGYISLDEAIRELMELMRSLGRVGGRNNQPLQATINVDGRQFAQIMTPYMSGQIAANVSATMGGA